MTLLVHSLLRMTLLVHSLLRVTLLVHSLLRMKLLVEVLVVAMILLCLLQRLLQGICVPIAARHSTRVPKVVCQHGVYPASTRRGF
jgi:hypothetical protein